MFKHLERKTLAWAFYDWANSAYATTVIAGFFPIFFKQYWSSGAPVTHSTFQLGMANSTASLVVALLAPLLGAIADRIGSKKKFLLFFALQGAVMTGALSLVGQGQWQVALALYGLATLGFACGNIFYDALLVDVSPRERFDFVSALGYSLGYLGGGLLFAVCVLMTLFPENFGLAGSAEAVRISFVLVAVWWAVFSLPVMLFVKETPVVRTGSGIAAVRGAVRQLAATFAHIRQLRVVALFLVGYWLYIDGVDTIINMAVDYGLSLGFAANNLIVALLITQFVGFPAAIVFGKLGERIGAKRAILIAISVYIGICLWAYHMDDISDFYGLAVAVGLVQGGIQSLSRSFYARLIPRDKAGEFFGFYNMLGKFAAVLGPGLMGAVALLTGDSRLSIFAVVVLFLLGGVILYRVNEAEGRRMAEELERV